MVNVRLEEVTKRFGEVVAADNITLEIRHGEFFTFLGPSGCGKTTTLRIIAGLEMPDKGKVFFNEKDVTNDPPYKRNTGMVFQNYALWPHMTVFDNIAYGLKIRRLPKEEIRRKVYEVLELVKLRGLENRYPTQLSGGQQQRVALARALAIEPKIMLLDEPMSNIDPILRSRLRSDLKSILKRLNITAVYVTHDRDDAFEIADRIAIMNDGVIEQVDIPEELFNKPKTKFVAEFVGVENTFKIDYAQVEELEKHLSLVIDDEVYIVLPKYLPKSKIAYFGIRPEKLIIVKEKPSKPPYIKGKVLVKAFKGVLSRYVIETPLGSIVVLSPSGIRNINIGDTVYLTYNIEDILLFSK